MTTRPNPGLGPPRDLHAARIRQAQTSPQGRSESGLILQDEVERGSHVAERKAAGEVRLLTGGGEALACGPDSFTVPHAVADQAAGLRSLMRAQAPRLAAVVAPNGVRIARPLAASLARQQRQIWLVEAAAPAQLLGVAPDGAITLMAPGRRPYASLAELAAAAGAPPQCVLVDAGAALPELMPLAAGAQVVLVAVPANDPTGAALTTAYACIKSLHARHALSNFRILPIACGTPDAAQEVFQRLATVAARYLPVTLGFAGYLPAADAPPVMRENAYARLARGVDDWFR